MNRAQTSTTVDTFCTVHGARCEPWSDHVTETDDGLHWSFTGLSPLVAAILRWTAEFFQRASREDFLAWSDAASNEAKAELMAAVVGRPSPKLGEGEVASDAK